MGQSWALWLIWLHSRPCFTAGLSGGIISPCHACQAVSACRIADGSVILERTPSQAPAPAEKEEEKKGTKEKEDGMKTPLLPLLLAKICPLPPLFFSIDSLLAQF